MNYINQEETYFLDAKFCRQWIVTNNVNVQLSILDGTVLCLIMHAMSHSQNVARVNHAVSLRWLLRPLNLSASK